mmetsp:Transcript_15151/g.32871  ORF Transcript_15151/g.32871 Transcript_15151/m.32871 type:complete len:237 (-) Transcript_15151:646-1356(-)|eukprot:CAMPEP_0202901096 /NCGR_PEP_ID=MMETSP1392-20130828/13216_1 /ASSEMBLY_ACC=CAM_ASM_000868 /TAXON_ID=225041 /ORGANISM="Chlamydomonas chlamydogama, Strain SAG 11-48b" /LENGTH=236 /DNA_ID=CAMNT_0049587595 /DNA_START=115 /DNA_END=825 /DNA_ORIENTATION=+
MGDNWDDDEWEAAADNFKPPAQAKASTSKPAVEYETKGQAILAGVNEPDMSKFADEDAEEEDNPRHNVVKPQPKKKEEKKYERKTIPQEAPLDDPIAEKLRQQRLVEQADYAAAKELFGDEAGVNLDLFLPKTVKDFEDYTNTLAAKYITIHRDNKNYKPFLKALFKAACAPLPSTEVKDLETSLAGLRADKFKAEQTALNAKKGKKQLNVGKSGLTAGLDDYVYDNVDDDDVDFM